ncbi:MAG: KOW domain-containing RNA-binding protein [Eubacteriales bacterium]|nr:KOW domain-containing RNA-binding protein [Eubacteriales bacterium]
MYKVVPGQVVYSKAGRDKGRVFIVLEVCEDPEMEYVRIADGKLRKADKAKLKKLKHLIPTGDIIGVIETKLKSKNEVTDAEIRKALRGFSGSRT